MSSSLVRFEQRGAIGLVTLDRPPANAIDLELGRQLEGALERALGEQTRALVLTGAGRFFSGGLDLRVVPTYSSARQRELLRLINRLIGRLYGCPVPVVAAINGHAIAGGLVVALATDYRIGPADDSLFGLTEARAGIPFPAAPMVVLQAELAPSALRATALQARNFDPEEARARGIVDELSPPEILLERAMEVARDLASLPADGYRRIKYQLRRAAIEQIEELVAADSDPMLQTWLDPEAAAASAAILDRPGQG